jgi:hypothetical protein
MSEKKLPIKYPLIITYPQETHLISIVSMHEQFLPWFHSNFIQLKCSLYHHDMDLKMYPDNFQRVCPLLEYQHLTRNSLGKWFPDIVNFIVQCIDDGLFFHATVNSYYISAYKRVFQKLHHFHEVLIFGYDSDLEVFFAADFFDANYEFKAIPFYEFVASYRSIDHDDHGLDINNHLNGIELMRFNPRSHFNKKSHYLLDIENIVDLLGDYVYSSNTSKKYTVFENSLDDTYGLSVYNFLIKHIELVLTGEISWCNYRSFHIFYEHKKCMVLRIKYLCDLGLYKDTKLHLDSLKIIEQHSLINKNKVMKYMISGDKKNIMNLTVLLKEMAIFEKETLSKLHEDLSKLITT